MTDPAQAANNDLNGVLDDTGFPRWWSWVDGRMDYILNWNQRHRGHNAPESIPGWGDPKAFNPNAGPDRGPYSHVDPKGGVHVGTPSHLDHGVLAAEAVGWRYVASDGHRYDLADAIILLLEDMIERQNPVGMAAMRARASQVRALPWDQS